MSDNCVQELKACIEQARNRMVEELEELTNINTHASNADGLRRAADRLEGMLSGAGLKVERIPGQPVRGLHPRIPNDLPTGDHIRAYAGPANGTPRLLLLGHYDTVFLPEDGFNTFTKISADRATGPGVNDMKGGLVAMIQSLRALNELKLLRDLRVDALIISDEEAGSPSSRELIESLAKGRDAALVYEPALEDGAFAGTRKGIGHAHLAVRGRSAHAGREPEKGVNAIVALAKLIVDIHKLNTPRAGMSVNTGIVRGGEARNRVPDLASCEIDFRFTRPADAKSLIAKLNKIARGGGLKDAEAELRTQITRPPKARHPALEKFVRAAHKTALPGRPFKLEDTGGGSDGNFTSALGIPTMDSLGTVGELIHSPEETIHLPSLAERALLSAVILQRAAEEGATWRS